MSHALRRSSQLARISRQSVELASRSQARTRLRSLPRYTCIHQQRIRRYATVEPEKPEKDNRKKDAANDGTVAGETGEGAEKSAVGAGDKKGVNFSQHQAPQSSGSSPTPPGSGGDKEAKKDGKGSGLSKLTPEEEQRLNDILESLRRGMPAAQAKTVEKAFEKIKEGGVPKELREIMDEVQNGKGLTLSTAARLVRFTTKLARSTAEEIAKEEEKQEKTTDEPRQKAGVHDPGPQQEQKQSGNKKNESFNGFNPPEFKMVQLDMGTMIVSAFVSYILYKMIFPGENSREITWQEFRGTFLEKALVDKIVVLNRSRAKVYLHRDAVASMYPESPAAKDNFYYYFSIGSVEAFERKMDEAQNELQIASGDRIPVAYTDEISLLSTLLNYGPTLFIIGSIIYFSRRAGGAGGGASGVFGMGRSRAKKFNHETDIKVKFADVAGMDEAKVEIMEFVSFLKEPGVYQKLGAKIPRGAILSGPPGTGKTLLAKATAGESGVPFFSVSGSEFVEMFVGVGPSRVRDLFANARKNTPCIIFIDEIDAIGKSRSKQNFGGGTDERESTLNQILTEMDGFNTSEQVVVLAGTNRADVLDQALLRPGRFDRHIAIDKPTMDGRKQIFAVHLKKIVTKEDIEHLKGRLAALTPGFSGADIANCVNEAALIAARHTADSVSMTHFEQAIERVVGGLEKKSLVLSPQEKRTVAYHEAGHAICGWYFKYADPLLKVSIIPRGSGALGYAQYLPAGETYLMNVHQLMDRMAMTLGGRVSEELHFDTVTTGASDDFNKVTRMAAAMVTKWGMSSKIGYIYFDDDQSQTLHKPFSEETAKNIDMEVKRIVDEAYKQCKDLLTEKKKEVGIVAEELLKKEMLTRDDIVRLLGPRPFEDNQDFSKYFGGKGDREGAGDVTPGPVGPSKVDDIPGGGQSPPAPALFKQAKRGAERRI